MTVPTTSAEPRDPHTGREIEAPDMPESFTLYWLA
jgi:hypothetical protein